MCQILCQTHEKGSEAISHGAFKINMVGLGGLEPQTSSMSMHQYYSCQSIDFTGAKPVRLLIYTEIPLPLLLGSRNSFRYILCQNLCQNDPPTPNV